MECLEWRWLSKGKVVGLMEVYVWVMNVEDFGGGEFVAEEVD